MRHVYSGGCIDGPWMGKNLQHYVQVYRMIKVPTLSALLREPPPPDDGVVNPLDMKVGEYRFDEALKMWRWNGAW